MSLSFLPQEIKSGLDHLNYNLVSEIRLRRGAPVSVEYCGEYGFVTPTGFSKDKNSALIVYDVASILTAALGGDLFNYTEQMKNGFVTVGRGVRIGIAGEYVTDSGRVNAIRNVTSLNIRIAHDIAGCSAEICNKLYLDGIKSTLIFSKPGLGKTTILRDISKNLSKSGRNILVFDERNEIAAITEGGEGFDLGNFTDVIRCHNKLGAISSAIRAMKPDVIITDELYGDDDISAMRYADDCGIKIIASSHICRPEILKTMPFEFYVKLSALNKPPEIYDKNFNSYCDNRADDVVRGVSVGEEKEENDSFRRDVRV